MRRSCSIGRLCFASIRESSSASSAVPLPAAMKSCGHEAVVLRRVNPALAAVQGK